MNHEAKCNVNEVKCNDAKSERNVIYTVGAPNVFIMKNGAGSEPRSVNVLR